MVTALLVKTNQVEQRDAKLMRRERDLAKKSDEVTARAADVDEREAKIKDFEAAEKMLKDSKENLSDAKALSGENAKAHELELKEVAKQRKFLLSFTLFIAVRT